MTKPLPTLQIDVVSDVVCPWCIIGYRQLEQATTLIADRVGVEVRWHPFELAPDMPPEGQLMSDYARERYGASPVQSRGNQARIMELGVALGIDFRFSPTSRMYNSNKAHQLLLWAGEQGNQTALKLALFKDYFTAKADISNEQVLIAAAASAGLDPEEAAKVLQRGNYKIRVAEEFSYWQDQNITGVPAYVVNGKYMIPGAQDAATFVRVFERVLDREAASFDDQNSRASI